jgi:hypothetical protein
MRQDDEFVAQTEPRETRGDEYLELASEVYIPDYVMLDFGLLEVKSTSAKLATS